MHLFSNKNNLICFSKHIDSHHEPTLLWDDRSIKEVTSEMNAVEARDRADVEKVKDDGM